MYKIWCLTSNFNATYVFRYYNKTDVALTSNNFSKSVPSPNMTQPALSCLVGKRVSTHSMVEISKIDTVRVTGMIFFVSWNPDAQGKAAVKCIAQKFTIRCRWFYLCPLSWVFYTNIKHKQQDFCFRCFLLIGNLCFWWSLPFEILGNYMRAKTSAEIAFC